MRRILLLLISALASSLPAAATTYRAGVGCNGPGVQDVQVWPNTAAPAGCSVGFAPVTGFNSGASALGTGGAGASAGPSGLHLWARSILEVSAATSGQGSWSAQAWAEAVYDDFLLTGPGPGSVTSVLNLLFTGSMFGAAAGDTLGPLTTNILNGNGQIYFQIDINGSYAGSGQAYYAANRNGVVAVDLLAGNFFTDQPVGGGLFPSPGVGINAMVPSSQLLLPVGQVFSVRIYANVTSTSTVGIAGTPADEHDTVTAYGLGGADYDSTITFARSGPVFDLPEGYTINSPSAGIVNNQFVPEPAIPLLAAVGGLALQGWRRTRHRH